jgi:hypothetical protein
MSEPTQPSATAPAATEGDVGAEAAAIPSKSSSQQPAAEEEARATAAQPCAAPATPTYTVSCGSVSSCSSAPCCAPPMPTQQAAPVRGVLGMGGFDSDSDSEEEEEEEEGAGAGLVQAAEVADSWEELLDDDDQQQQQQRQQQQQPSTPEGAEACSAQRLWGLPQGAADQLCLLGGAQLLALRRIRQLGAGSEGVVYEVEALVQLPNRSTSSLRLALKVVPDLDEDGFQEQCATWAAVQAASTYALPLLASGSVDDGSCRSNSITGLFLMPMAAGTLQQVAQAAAPSERARLAGVAGRALVRLLADLQAAGLRYTDFKLANLLVMPCGALVLADFGFVAHLPRPWEQEQGGSCKAPVDGVTPLMTSPEVARGATLAGCEYDVWCVGVLLLEMVLGRASFVDLFVACSGHRHALGIMCTMVDVASLHAMCSSHAEWQQPGVAELGAVLFSTMLVAAPQRSCSAQLLQHPCFSAAPTRAELALLRCC